MVVGSERPSERTGAKPKRVVLLGAGHAHLYTIKRAAEFARRGFEFILVAPDMFWYSGLATGMLGGMYPPSLDRVDVSAMAAKGGGRFVCDKAVRIDSAAQTIHLEHNPPLTYDAVSLNLGSEIPNNIPGAETAYAVKPIRKLWELHEDLERRLRAAAPSSPVRMVIAGGGATACELAGNAKRLAEMMGKPIDLTLVTRDGILKQFPAASVQTAVRGLEQRGVRFKNGAVEKVESGDAVTADGARVAFDVFVNATGLKPSPLIRTSGLPVDDDGALIVDEHLRSAADGRVHGGGDCIVLRDRKLAKVGVYAVRQAPIIFENLLASLTGGTPRRFEPQRHYLLILNMGDGRGLATRGKFHWHGRLAFRLKDWIDRRFLAQYQRAV
jgi:NADH dehydrogenase FAD-containing subunit